MEIEAERLATSLIGDAYGAGVDEEWDPAKMLQPEKNNKQRKKRNNTAVTTILLCLIHLQTEITASRLFRDDRLHTRPAPVTRRARAPKEKCE
jgi:hypothetical protein